MQDIIAGLRSFQRDVYPQHRELFERLARGQSPKAMVITCSDSRVDPFMLTQTDPGKLFVLRNAGNIVPAFGEAVGGVTATIEYAVVALRVENIVVCGHSSCGAMAGLLNPESLRDMPNVADWLHHTGSVRQSLIDAGDADGPKALASAVEANVVVQLSNLRTHPSVAKALAEGQITLHGWVYDIGSGQVQAYDDRQQQFGPL